MFVGRIVSYDDTFKVHGWVKRSDPAKKRWKRMTWTIRVGQPDQFACESFGADKYGCAHRRSRV